MTRFGRAEGVTSSEIADLQPARNGGMWVVGDTLQKVTDAEEFAVTTVAQLPGLGVSSLCEDREGSLWLCAKERGLVRARQMPYRLITSGDGLPGNSVRSIAEDAAGNLWLAIQSLGVARVAPGGAVALFARTEMFPGSNPTVVHAAKDGALWVGSAGPLCVTRAGVTRSYAEVRGVYGIFEDRHGTVWLGTAENGVLRYRDGQFEAVRLESGDPILHATWFCEGHDDAIYICTWVNGLVKIMHGQTTVFNRSNGLPTDEVRAAYVDADGHLWVGLRGRGLALLQENGQWWNPHELSEALTDHVTALVEDERGQLWFGTAAGVMWAPKGELLAAARGERAIADIHLAKVNGSLRAASVWSGPQSVVCQTQGKKLLFATRQGILAIDPKSLPINNALPPVYIEKVQIDRHVVDSAAGVSVSAGARDVTIDYTALSFVQPNQVFFRYKLEGYDRDWIDARSRRTAYYGSLPPGRYTFRVKACNADGIWNETGAQLALVQQPHFYETGWFYALVSLAAVGLAVGVYRWSHRQLRLRLERLEQRQAMEKERRRIAKNLHDDLGANLTEIGLFTETIRGKISSPEALQEMDLLSDRVRTLAGTLDAVVWAVNPANDSLDRLTAYISGHFQDVCRMASIRCRLDVPAELPACSLSPEQRSNLFLTAKEAINNIVKHAAATEAWLRVRWDGVTYHLTIEDNGRGFDPGAARDGEHYGLLNMRSRVEELHGVFLLTATPGQGTSVALSIPMPPPGTSTLS